MKLVCQILSSEPNGRIPFDMFMDIYRYLAKIDGTITCEKAERVRAHLEQHHVSVFEHCSLQIILNIVFKLLYLDPVTVDVLVTFLVTLS